MQRYFLLITFILLCHCVPVQAQDNQKASAVQQKPAIVHPSKTELAKIKQANISMMAKTQLQYFIIRADSARFGYSIYANGHLYIQQSTIPALPGNRGFADTAAAGSVARFVIQKMKAGILPPSVSAADLKKLHIK